MNSSLQGLSRLLQKAILSLAGEKPNTSGLREIQLFIWNERFLSSLNNNERFLMFFLDCYIEKIFFNLVGDVPYRDGVTKEIQTQFYKELSLLLENLREKVEKKLLEDAYQSYEQLGILYLDTVNRLNNKLVPTT